MQIHIKKKVINLVFLTGLLLFSLVLGGCDIAGEVVDIIYTLENEIESNPTDDGAESPQILIESDYELADENGLEVGVISKVVDGDTVKVIISDNEYIVRLIGIDTPESVHPDKERNTEYGVMSSDYAKALIKINDIVYLERDVSDTDNYGRLLRYLWLEIPKDSNNEDEIRTKMYNAIIVGDGYANAYKYAPDIKNFNLFSQIEFEAYTDQLGLWTESGALNDENVIKQKQIIDGVDGYTYIANIKSLKVHVQNCKALPIEDNRIYFETLENALDNGYSPCKTCMTQ